MRRFKRILAAVAAATALTLGGGAAAQAAPHAPTAQVQEVATTQTPTALLSQDQGGDSGLCSALKYLHWTAEMLLEFVRLQPIFDIIDKPLIHPLLWTPLDGLTGGCGVNTHPPELS